MWIVSWLLQKTFQINLLVAFTSMRKLQWQLVLFFWIVWLQGLTICSPIRFRFLIIIMGSFGRAEPLTCKRCGLSSIVVDDTFVCEACVSEECFLVCLQKQHIYIHRFSFFQQHRTAYPSIRLQSRVAMQALVLEAIVTVHLQSNFTMTAPFCLHLRIDRTRFPLEITRHIVHYFRRFERRTAFRAQYNTWWRSYNKVLSHQGCFNQCLISSCKH